MPILGSFNGFFKKNNNVESRMDERFGDKSYKTYVSSVDDLIKNYNNGIKVDFFESANLKNARSMTERLGEAKMLREAMRNGEKIISYDTETVGALGSTKNAFAITEYAASVKDYRTNTVSPLINLDMGVNKDIGLALYNDIDRAFEGDVSESARVTIDRVPFLTNQGIEVNRINTNKAIRNLGSKDLKFGDSLAVSQRILKEAEKINELKDNITIGYNIKNFDNIARAELLKRHGLDIGLLSTNREVDIQEIFMSAFDTSIHDMYASKGMGDVKGKFRVENLAKLFGVDAGTSHVAEDDTLTVFKILEASYDGGDETVLDKAVSNISQKINGANFVRNGGSGDIVYRAIKSNNPVENYSFNKSSNKNGAISNNGFQKHLDYMVDDYSGNVMTYRDRSSSRGLFYEPGEMRVIPRSYLDETTLKAIGEDAQEAYVLPLKSYGDSKFGHTSYIVRGSKEEIEDALSNNFGAYKLVDSISEGDGSNVVTKKVAKMQEEIYFNDLARRNFDAMFETGSNKDFNYAKNMYGAYNELNENYRVLGGIGKLNKSQINELASNGAISVGENSLTLMDHAKSLRRNVPDPLNPKSYIKGDLVTEWVRDFNTMYGILDDTNDVISPIIKSIEQNVTFSNKDVANMLKGTSKEEVGPVINRAKKEALSKSYNDIIETTKDITGKEELYNEVINNYDVNFYKYADILDGDTYRAINVSSVDDAIEGLSKKVYANSRTARNEATRRNMAVSNLVGISKDLNDRGIISETLFDEIKNTGDPNSAIKKVASEVFEYGEIARGNLPDEKLARAYIENILDGKNERFLMLQNMRKGVPSVRDMSGFKLNGRSFSDFVASNSEELSGMLGVDNLIDGVVMKNISNATDVFNLSANGNFLDSYARLSNNKEKIGMLPEKFTNYLRANMNYKDKEIAAVADMLYHTRLPQEVEIAGEMMKASTRQGSGYLTRGYGATFVQGNNKGDRTHGFLIYNPNDATEVINAYNRGDISPKAAYQPLPTPTEQYGKRFLKQGNSNKMITENLGVYSEAPITYSNNISIRETNTITDILYSQRIVKDNFDEAMKIGDTETASRLLNNKYNNVVGNEIGTSVFRRVGGKKTFVANMNDLMEYKKASGLMGLLPSLYYEDKEIASELNSLFGEDTMNKSFTSIQNAIKSHDLDKFQLRGDIQEWYMNNMFYGKNLAERMSKLGNLSAGSKEAIEKTIIEANNGSMLVKDSMAGKYNLIFSKENFAEYDPFSEYDNPLRPLHNQRLSMKPIVYDELINNAKERGIDDIQDALAKNRIYLGGFTRSSKGNNRFHVVSEMMGTPIYEGLSAKVSQMPSGVYYEIVNALNANELKNEFMKTNKAITQTDVDYILRSYQNLAGTNEQHGVLRPSIAKYASPNPDTISVKLNGIDASGFNIGDTIDNNTVTGRLLIDGKSVDTTHKKVSGKIVDIDYDSNIIQIEPSNRSFNEIKFNLGGEKTVATPILGKNNAQYEFSEFLYDKIFGEDISLAGHFEIGKHKNAGLLLQGRFDSAIEMLNIYGNESDFKLFEDVINQSGLGWNLKFTDDSRTGLKYAIKDMSEVNGNAFTMLDTALFRFSKATANSDLSLNIEQEIINDFTNNTYRATLRFADLNEYMQSADDELGRKIKDTPRKRQVIGSTIAPGFRTLNDYGELERVIQPVVDMNLENIQKTPAFKKAFRDMGNIYNAANLIEGGKENGIDLITKNLLDLDVNSKNLTIDKLYGNVYGLDADKYSVLKLNLKNQKVLNPVTGRKESSVYLPILHTNIMDDTQIYPSKSQSISADFLRKLSMRENLESLAGTKFHNYEELEKEISNAYENIFNSLSYEYSSKTGLMNEMILSGRVELSGMALTSGVIPNEFIDESKRVMSSKLGNTAIKMINGKPVYEDIIWASSDYLESLGFDADVVGRNLAKNKFAANKQFIETAKIHGLVGANNKVIDEEGVFAKLGNLYASKVGINSIATREPSFHPGSTRAAKVRMLDTLEGYSIVLPPWMAGPQVADVDGDNEFIQLVGLKKTSEGVVLRSADDKITKSVESLFDLQTLENDEYVKTHNNLVKINRYDTGEFTGRYEYTDPKEARKYTTSYREMSKIIDEEYGMSGNINFFSKEQRERFQMLGAKVRQNKGGIGYISNENFKIREMAFAGLDKDYMNIAHYNNIIDFTTLTEQKIIDVKHSNVERLTVAPKYQQGIIAMASDNEERFRSGFSMVVDSVRDSEMYGDEIIADFQDIMSGNFENNKANNQLRAIYDLFNDEELVDVYNENAFTSISNVKYIDKESTKKLLNEIRDEDTSDIVKSKISRYNNDLVRKASKQDSIIVDDFILKEGSIIEGTKDYSYYKINSIDRLNSQAVIQNILTDETTTVFETRDKTLDELFKDRFSILLGKEADDAIKAGGDINKISNKIERMLYDSPERTLSFLKANEISGQLGNITGDRSDFIEESIKGTGARFVAVSDIIAENEKTNGLLFKAFNQNYTELDKDMLKFTHGELNNLYKDGKITRTQFSEELYRMNNDIIKKGADAKARREIANQYIQNDVMETVRRNTSNNAKLDYKTFNEKLQSMKIYDIDEMKSSYTGLLEENSARVFNAVKNQDLANEIIGEGESYVNQMIKNAKSYNGLTGEKKTLLYAENFDYYGGRERLLNWNDRNKRLFGLIKEDPKINLSDGQFRAISRAKIGFGEYADLRLRDLDIDTLKQLSNIPAKNYSENVRKLMGESQENINSYINYIVTKKDRISNEYRNIKTNITTIAKPLEEDFGVEAMNKRLIELAKKRKFDKRKAFKETIEDVSTHMEETDGLLNKLSKNKFFVAAGALGAGAIALSVLGGSTPVRQGNVSDNRPMPKESRDRKPTTYSAPPSITPQNRSVMQGVNMKVSGKANRNIDNKQLESQMTSMFKNSVGNEVNINTTENDNREEIKDNWLKDKISRIFN